MENIQQARNALRKFEGGNKGGWGDCYRVTERLSLFDGNGSDWSRNTRGARKKQSEIMLKLKNCIDSHERGNEVYETNVDFSDSGGCSGVIM